MDRRPGLARPSEASELGLGVPARGPLKPPGRPWGRALGQDRAEEEERKGTGSSPLSQAQNSQSWREAAAPQRLPGRRASGCGETEALTELPVLPPRWVAADEGPSAPGHAGAAVAAVGEGSM